ncbi:glucosamine-6-phosphate deaminase [Staphylococcus edaphicus]|uniref:Glucosamine-6-phosphate deaminase n=1 Tax=Staphylococcus edaphicus TaxID=1955013 RepID=A0A2C6WQ83_9STAP|nr:glucosamine-6-phosphate deaminase [Staphylococcus edaphicus]PHK49954.1 glucosamine-6-phosphate deaminase [Staphylococcus edaphicus]UQW81785.1 glucosamine-6-phosphate deaminase [Staphylococcus edaphicus]
MNVINLKNRTIGSQYVATEILKQLIIKPDAVLGLATGNTMVDVYKHLSELLNINKIDLSNVVTFNLDEYVGLSAEHKQSYHVYMHEHLFNNNDTWNKAHLHLPVGDAINVEYESENYEKCLSEIGPADIQILGIGENGHIGFNEPHSSFASVTRVVDLTPSTIHANRQHFERIEDVPKQAISMGLSSIMRAKRIILIAFGKNKQQAINQLLKGEISEVLPASILHKHPNVEVIIDDDIFTSIL